MSILDSLDIRVRTEEVLQLLRTSLTSGSVLGEVFGKVLTKRDSYMLASFREFLSHTDNISSMSHELLRSLERGRDSRRRAWSTPTIGSAGSTRPCETLIAPTRPGLRGAWATGNCKCET